MKKIIEKLVIAERKLSDEKGAFHLFALFLREDASDKWDLVVSASWLSKDKASALKYIASIIQKTLNANELLKISRIVIIDEDNPSLEAIHQAFKTEHEAVEILSTSFFGLDIKRGFLITSKKDSRVIPEKVEAASG